MFVVVLQFFNRSLVPGSYLIPKETLHVPAYGVELLSHGKHQIFLEIYSRKRPEGTSVCEEYPYYAEDIQLYLTFSPDDIISFRSDLYMPGGHHSLDEGQSQLNLPETDHLLPCQPYSP